MNEDEIIAALASNIQRHNDRLDVMESVFKDSIVIPGCKIPPILLSIAVIVLMLCMTFAFCFWMIRPL